MQCPLCNSSLKLIEYEGVPIHTCNSCGGELVGGEELAHIVQTKHTQFEPQIQSQLADHKPDFGGTAALADRALTCPACNEAMQIINYGCDSGVFVDRCNVCRSIWLDHSELDRIQYVMEKWAEESNAQLAGVINQLEDAKQSIAEHTSPEFRGSRFSFVNAVMTRLLNAA